MGFLLSMGVPLLRQSPAAYAAAPPPPGNVFASENWEGRSVGSNPQNTSFQVGIADWTENFGTVVSSVDSPSSTQTLAVPFEGYENEVKEIWYAFNENKTELYFEYWIFIPENYTIVDSHPDSDLALGGGNKEWVIFSDEYSGFHFTIILGSYFQRREYDGGPAITPPTKIFQLGNISAMALSGEREYDTIPHSYPYEQECLIDIEVDLGTWQLRSGYLKMPTTPISNDGIFKYSVKKANGITYEIVNVDDGWWYGANPLSTGGNYVNGGYFLGSCTSGYAEPTTFLLGDIDFADP